MKTVSAICFALATAVTASALSVAPSYAQTYSSDQQACAYSNDGDCLSKTSHNMAGPAHVSHDHARSSGRAQ
jgi:Spy/CpxP family protein refolding chaperone